MVNRGLEFSTPAFSIGLQSSTAEFYYFADSFTLAVQDHCIFVAWY